MTSFDKDFSASHVSRETDERLTIYYDLLIKWQSSINLVSATQTDIWNRHIADSLQLICLAPKASRWVDLGSGGGFPGLVVACALADEDDSHVWLVESNQKKAAFLRAVIRETGSRAEVLCDRVEIVGESWDSKIDAVSARALAPLTKLLHYAKPFLQEGATGFFHKGKDYRAEIEEANCHWRYKCVTHQNMTSDGVILEIEGPNRLI